MKDPTGIHSDRRGSAVVLALIVVVVIGGLGAAYLQVSTALTHRQSNEVENLKAFYLAEAGLAEAFHAVRVGRTGQVGSLAAPARHGDGLLWVDATATGDDQVRLESTALVGSGRSTLALVVEPIEIPLGFFSDQELVIDSVLLMDGFDSEEGTYQEQLLGDEITIDPTYEFLNIDADNKLLFYEGSFHRFHAVEGNTYYYDHSVSVQTLSESEIYGDKYEIDYDDFIDDGGDDFTDLEYEGVLAYFSETPIQNPATGGGAPSSSITAPTTGEGGLLGSNGDVTFLTPEGDPATVYGDVVAGPDGSVTGNGVVITGDIDSRTSAVDLPEVEVPPVSMKGAVRHDAALPMLISPGTVGYERIEVAPDAELILRGPATVVIGTLVLEPGALLTLDTRDGNVELYITGDGLDLQPGSALTTSSELAEQSSIQVAPIETGPGGAPVKLDAASQFYGTIYAPETDVYVGSDFEMFGGIVARKLEIGAGASLHFDSSGFDGSPIPRIVSWKIIEVPVEARSRKGDLYSVLGVDPADSVALSEAHDLKSVKLDIDYLDHDGVECNFSGTEDQFDWDKVADVLGFERDPQRVQEGPVDTKTGGEDPLGPNDDPARQEILDAIVSLTGVSLRDYLQGQAPLNAAELNAMIDADSMSSAHQDDVLQTSLPVPERVLLNVLDGTSGLNSNDLRDILLVSSPLTPSVADLVANAPGSVLTPGHRDQVLAAQ